MKFCICSCCGKVIDKNAVKCQCCQKETCSQCNKITGNRCRTCGEIRK